MEREFRFSKQDTTKEYGIKYYFEKALESENTIKSIGFVTNNDYIFTMFDSNIDHTYFINENRKKLGITDDYNDDVFMFSCDNQTKVFTINFFNVCNHKNTKLHIGNHLIKILSEYKKFVDENKDNLDFKNVRLNLDINFYRNNEVDIYYERSYKGFTNMIDDAIISLYNETKEAIREKEEEKMRKEVETQQKENENNKVLIFIKKMFNKVNA